MNVMYRKLHPGIKSLDYIMHLLHMSDRINGQLNYSVFQCDEGNGRLVETVQHPDF